MTRPRDRSTLRNLAPLAPLLLTLLAARPGRADLDPPAPAPAALVLGQPGGDYRARRAEVLRRVEAMALLDAMRTMVAETEGSIRAEPVVVLIGEGAGDDEGKFRQDNDFAYLTGVDVPFAAAILRPGDGGEALYLPPRNPGREKWEGPGVGPGPEAAARFHFDRVESTAALLGDLFEAAADPIARGPRPKASVIYTLAPDRGKTRSAEFARWLREGLPNTPVRDLTAVVHELRGVKSAGEVALLRRAIAITGEALDDVARLVRPGVPEYGLEGAILGAFVRGGALRPGFPTIVGSGPNATVLHYMRNDRTTEPGDLVVVDIGAEFRNYTADITRTFPVDGRFTPRQRAIYQLVLDAQAAAEAEVKPGETTLEALGKFVREYFRKSPLRAKDLEGNERTMEAFFTHGLGHHLGMDVHDVIRPTAKLVPGSVFTIEPGLYIPSETIGVRIEDDYLVTEHGLEKLTSAIPSAPDAVEQWIERSRDGASSGALTPP